MVDLKGMSCCYPVNINFLINTLFNDPWGIMTVSSRGHSGSPLLKQEGDYDEQ